MNNNSFAVFILTHGRADNVSTYAAIRRFGYTGKIFLLIDNEDDEADKYIENYGDEVVIFDKIKAAENCDSANNFHDRRAILFARNYCFDLAKEKGLEYFIELDDDYTSFEFRFDDKLFYNYKSAYNLDFIFDSLIDFIKNTGAKSIAIAQGGDFMGGADGSNPYCKNLTLIRKCMNSFVCNTDNGFKFAGTMNDDVNTYTSLATRGNLFFTFTGYSLSQKASQATEGGMSDVYKDGGTYLKSFYSVMFHPSGVKVAMLQSHHTRIHHKVTWNKTAPKIIRESFKKVSNNE